jgi:hypothetical protein
LSEEVIGLIGPLEGKGEGNLARRFALVFTKNELICVKIGGTLSLLTPLLSESLNVGLGLPTISDVYSRIVNKRVGELKNKQVQDLLDLDELNFSIPYDDILRIEVQKKSVLSPKGRRIIEFATRNRKYWFRIVDIGSYDYCVNLVQNIPLKYRF